MGEPIDPRVSASVAVLAGGDPARVAESHGLEEPLVRRWTAQFLRGGTAAVRNQPLGDEVAARDRLLAAVNHELRTPVTVIRGYATLLGNSAISVEQSAALQEKMAGQFRTLDATLARLTETTAASLGRLELSLEPTTLATVLAPFGARVEPDGPLTADVARVRTIVEDLVALAHEGPDTTDVRVVAGAEPDRVHVTVERDGAPFDPARLAAELDPFSPRDSHEDVTFGLHLARALVVLHGGQLGIRRVADHDELWLRLPTRPHTDHRTTNVIRLHPDG